MAAYIADRRLYLDKNGKVVEANDPTRAVLLVGAGGTLPEARARELGLVAVPAPVEDEKAKADPPATKARKAAPENK